MKRFIAVFCLVLGFSAQCSAYDGRLVHVLEQLRECKDPFGRLPMVGGPAIGAAASPHEFFLLFSYVVQIASDDDLKEMLADQSPVVRIMGAKSAIIRKVAVLGKALDELQKDQTKICVAAFGCSITEWTVGEVVAELKKNPAFLENKEERQPNQALQHNDPSCHESCLRTPRASRDRG